MQSMDICMHMVMALAEFFLFHFQVSLHKAGTQTRQSQKTPSTLNDDTPTNSSSSVKSHCKWLSCTGYHRFLSGLFNDTVSCYDFVLIMIDELMTVGHWRNGTD